MKLLFHIEDSLNPTYSKQIDISSATLAPLKSFIFHRITSLTSFNNSFNDTFCKPYCTERLVPQKLYDLNTLYCIRCKFYKYH